MAVHGRPTKRARRTRVTADPFLLDMRSFPDGHERAADAATFSASIRVFLEGYAAPAPVLGATGAVWQVGFGVGEESDGAVVLMDVVEEDVPRSRRVHCEHCTVAGWSRHPVCGKKYHFIIRNDDMPNCKTCRRCGLMVDLSATRCPSCNHGSSHDDTEDWDYGQLDNQHHLLHGIVHENGFSHLANINGHEGGSSLLTGYQLMDFWDRLCGYLRVRKVSVIDVSRKFEVAYRILHAVATGCSWYGQWGFRLGCASFGITPEDYCKAIDNLSAVPLSNFFPHSRSPRNQLQDTIALYQSISKRPLNTIRDLFLYILGLTNNKSMHPPLVSMHKKEQGYDVADLEEGKWADDEIQRANNILLKVLCAADRWVALRSLKAATSHPVGSPQLVDYCLKTISGTRTNDGMIVAVRCNSSTNTMEYRLTNKTILLPRNACMPSREHLLRDIKFLYDALLYPHTMHPYKPEQVHEHAKRSAMILLDCKQFIKHYDLEEDYLPQKPSMVHIWCQVELVDQVGEQPRIPAELITLPPTATVADLKMEATRTFRNIYLMLQSFVAEQLLDCASASDTTQVKLLFGVNGTVRIKGRCIGGERRVSVYRMERGVEKWTVNCSCGAKDDDGERMLSCDSCHVWLHTRCAGISDFDQVPRRHVCKSCKVLRKPNMYSGAPNM